MPGTWKYLNQIVNFGKLQASNYAGSHLVAFKNLSFRRTDTPKNKCLSLGNIDDLKGVSLTTIVINNFRFMLKHGLYVFKINIKYFYCE